MSEDLKTVTESVAGMFRASPEYMILAFIVFAMLGSLVWLRIGQQQAEREQLMSIQRRLDMVASNQFVLTMKLLEMRGTQQVQVEPK